MIVAHALWGESYFGAGGSGMLRPLTDPAVEHSLFPASLGILFRPANGLGSLTVDLAWTYHGTAFRVAARVNGGDLKPLRAAIGRKLAEESECHWRVSFREIPD